MNSPKVMESYVPCSGRYSLRKDLHLNAWLAVTMAVYLAALFLVKRNPEWSPLARGLFVLAPLVPILLYLRAWMRLVRGLDELQRRIQLEAFLFAALGTLLIGYVVNTLGANGVPLGGLSHGLDLPAGCIALFTLWLVGGALANRRYR
jgi:hypothetical protein